LSRRRGPRRESNSILLRKIIKRSLRLILLSLIKRISILIKERDLFGHLI